ncbi:hypothetical protein ACS0PU_009118 [Formica fusca]
MNDEQEEEPMSNDQRPKTSKKINRKRKAKTKNKIKIKKRAIVQYEIENIMPTIISTNDDTNITQENNDEQAQVAEVNQSEKPISPDPKSAENIKAGQINSGRMMHRRILAIRP